jgi:hypothetical protein
VIRSFDLAASSTNEYVATSTLRSPRFTPNSEYQTLIELFSTSSATSTETIVDRLTGTVNPFNQQTTTPTSTIPVATTTKEWQGVRLYEHGGEVYARFVGSRENMPYYYCAEDFPPYEPEATTTALGTVLSKEQEALVAETVELIHPVQTVPVDAVCDPVIKIDRRDQEVSMFDFFRGSTDFILMTLEDGIYVVEVDDRAWQNIQPLLIGENLNVRIENGLIYVYDGELIYQIILE